MSPKSRENILVLLVDDQMAMRKIIKTVLQHLGVKLVIEAADGVEAYNTLRQRNLQRQLLTEGINPDKACVDLIISDWRMPKMNGLELLDLIRKDTKLSGLPFIMLTAENDNNQIHEAITLGVNDYIIKPFTSKTLEGKLINILEKL